MYLRPSAKPICDEQFLGEAQSSTAEYSGVFEEQGYCSSAEVILLLVYMKRRFSLALSFFRKVIRENNIPEKVVIDKKNVLLIQKRQIIRAKKQVAIHERALLAL